MSKAFWITAVIIGGIIGMIFLMMLLNFNATDQQNYYLLKEVTQAAMVDAVDVVHYRTTGEIKIYQEKFVENFTRRWAESADRATDYEIIIYDIIESPPKVSLEVTGYEYSMVSKKDEKITNRLDMILETTVFTEGK